MTQKFYSHQTFRPNDDVDKILGEINLGQKSDFINQCIVCHAKEIGIKIEKKEPTDKTSESLGNYQELKDSSLTLQNKSEEAEVTMKKNYLGLQPKIRNIGKPIVALRVLENKSLMKWKIV